MKISIAYAHEKYRKQAKDFLPMLKKVSAKTSAQLKKENSWIETAAIIGPPSSLELLICGDKEMREFQLRHRKLDRTTDVLSFPTRESPEHAPRGFLGTIILSLETIERAAARVGRSTEDELAEVFIHGILHLIGHDHVDVAPAKAARMRKLQAELFRATLE